MIEKMKKVSIVSLQDDHDEALKTLRDLEIIHVNYNRDESSELGETLRKVDELDTAVRALREFTSDEQVPAGNFANMDLDELAQTTVELVHELAEARETVMELHREVDEWMPWGNFSLEAVNELRSKGLKLELCRCSVSNTPDIPEGAFMIEVARAEDDRCFLVASCNEFDADGLPTIKLPEHSLVQLNTMIREQSEDIDKLKKRLSRAATQQERLEKALLKRAEAADFVRAGDAMAKEGRLEYITGYIPANRRSELIQMAYRRGWALLIEDPSEDDTDIPTLLRVPKWLQISKPIFDFVGIRPGYKEFDISAWFLIFLTIFYAMIFGDAGYGLLFTAIFLGLKFMVPKGKQLPINLMLVFSVATVIWGGLSGNFFGINPVKDPVLAGVMGDQGVKTIGDFYAHIGLGDLFNWMQMQRNVQMLCFLLGAIHLTIAHGWRALVTINSPKCLSQIGWISFIWGNFFLGSSLVARGPYEWRDWMIYFYVVGAVLVLLFSAPSWKLHKTIGLGIGEILSNGVNSFVDVLSYIRLFAVGMSSYYVANSFNNMGVGLMGGDNGPVVAALMFIVGLLVILFGHVLNVALAALGVLVHGIRLNTLEFSGHIGIEWAGIPFKAFARRVRKSQKL